MEQNMDSVKEEAKRPEDMGEETEKELPGEETTIGGETGQPEDAEGTESTEEQPEEFSDGEKLEQLQADYNTLRTTYDTLTDKYLRLTVEYENFRKRSQREKEAVYPDAVAATVEKFLQVVDNFERAMACETQDKEYKKGVDLIYSSLLDTLQKLQVEAYAQVGDSFEPELHNAVMHVEDENFGENVISAVFQKGYKIGERVIRHAMVQVAN
ncbi:MAG: nucleotide exchange factor GrpE [Oscillospiraceae bacterium]|nr:nucleotide exchange factor GrpE [Oscillospiraceae bacterium]